jgi:putative intracellular protease/amidase
MRPLDWLTALAAVLTTLPPTTAPKPDGGSSAIRPVAASGGADRLTLPAPKAGRLRPLVVVVAENQGAETTDFTVPYGVLKESGVADVRSLSTGRGPVRLFLALQVMADQTLAAFDAEQPAGADVVIVPAQMQPKDAALADWLRRQRAKGATIVSICEGARVLAHAGLLDGRRATTHWHALPELERRYPKTDWVRDRRYLQDGPIISTTGVTASAPLSLALVETIGGHEAAQETARRLGASDWSATHRTADFQPTLSEYARGFFAMGAFWRRDIFEAPLKDGVDEIGLALRADTWSRSFRAHVVTTGRAPVRSRRGLTILPDATPIPSRAVMPSYARPALQQLDATVVDLRHRYGADAAKLALFGLEYREEAARRTAPGAVSPAP